MEEEEVVVEESEIDRSEWFDCECSDPDHSARFTLLHGRTGQDEPPLFFVSMNLSQMRGFFGRIVTAFKYVFWKSDKSRFGDFEEMMFKAKDVRRLQEMLTEYEKEWKEYKDTPKKG